MGKFTVIPSSTFDALQIDAGVLLKNFDPANPVRPADEDIICATTGGVNPSCVATYSDYGEDVDNVPNNMMELKHLDGWECKISTTGLGTSPELIKLALGAADIPGSNKAQIIPRRTLKQSDFSSIWWVGDKANGGCVAIQLLNALSSTGFTLQTTKNGKGTVSLEITGHVSIHDQETVPMVFYSIDADFSDVTVAPERGFVSVYGTLVSDIQSNVEVDGSKIKGTLKFIEGGLAESGYLAGDGNFLALRFSNLDEDATSVKVGLDPSQGSGLVEIIGDPDMNGVFKITNKDTQVFKVVSSDNKGNELVQTYDLSELVCETE